MKGLPTAYEILEPSDRFALFCKITRSLKIGQHKLTRTLAHNRGLRSLTWDHGVSSLLARRELQGWKDHGGSRGSWGAGVDGTPIVEELIGCQLNSSSRYKRMRMAIR